jgi:hypothetical protein
MNDREMKRRMWWAWLAPAGAGVVGVVVKAVENDLTGILICAGVVVLCVGLAVRRWKLHA